MPTRREHLALRSARHARRWITGGPAQRRRLAREHLFRSLRFLTPSVMVNGADGLRYLVSTADLGIGRTLFASGAYGDYELAQALGMVREHGPARSDPGVFIDVGANIGTTTLPALAVHGFRRAIAVEPEPSNLRLLAMNVVANGLGERVAIIRAAASDGPGMVMLELGETNAADNRLRMGGPDDGIYGEATREVIEVPARLLDEIIESEGVSPHEVGMLWIDVQGFEAQVLAGATSLLAAGVPLVLEYWPYGLHRARGATALTDLLTTHYSRYVDLGDAACGTRGSTDPQPLSAMTGIGFTLAMSEHTNLLLLP